MHRNNRVKDGDSLHPTRSCTSSQLFYSLSLLPSSPLCLLSPEGGIALLKGNVHPKLKFGCWWRLWWHLLTHITLLAFHRGKRNSAQYQSSGSLRWLRWSPYCSCGAIQVSKLGTVFLSQTASVSSHPGAVLMLALTGMARCGSKLQAVLCSY